MRGLLRGFELCHGVMAERQLCPLHVSGIKHPHVGEHYAPFGVFHRLRVQSEATPSKDEERVSTTKSQRIVPRSGAR